MTKLIKTSIFLLIILSTNSFAQVRLIGLVSFNYSYGIPTGTLRSYIPQKPFHGANFDYRHFFKKNFSLGVHVGWNSFKTVIPRAVYETDRGTVSAVQSRFFYSFPFTFNAYYYFRSSQFVRPYIGGGLGLYNVNYQKWFGVFLTKRERIHFGFNPEVGVLVPFKNSGLGVLVNLRYNHVFYSYNEVKNLRYFEANVGLYIGNF
jgi:opacity protein-like surface antigen